MIDIRAMDPARDLQSVRRLWLDYLSWGNDQIEARHGFRLPVHETVERDLANIATFMPPDGCILLAFIADQAAGIACLHRIGPRTAEVKRMYVRPSNRGIGLGRAMLERLVERARAGGYESVRLDSPDFLTAAHALYRSNGFNDIEPYPESEIPDEYKRHWVFMERSLS